MPAIYGTAKILPVNGSVVHGCGLKREPGCMMCQANPSKKNTKYPVDFSDPTAERTVAIFSPDYNFALLVRERDVVHRPAEQKNISHSTLCGSQLCGGEWCEYGRGCNYYHLRRGFRVVDWWRVQINYQYVNPQACLYDRHVELARTRLTAYIDNAVPMVVPGDHILWTRANVTAETVIVPPGCATMPQMQELCHEFHYHQMCNRGESCCGVHMLTVNPEVCRKKYPWAKPLTVAAKEAGEGGEQYHTGNAVPPTSSPVESAASPVIADALA